MAYRNFGFVLKIVPFNKGSEAARRIVIDPGMRAERATVLALTRPSLAVTGGVELGGMEAGSSCRWEGTPRQPIHLEGNHLAVDRPAAGAALVSFEG